MHRLGKSWWIAGVALAGVAVHKLDNLEDDVDKIPTSP